MLNLLKPTTIDDTNLVSSSVPETDYTAWASGTTYAAGNRCIKASTHRIYESIGDGNVGHDPETDDGTNWINLAPTNMWAMFDQSVGTITETSAPPLIVSTAPGFVDSVALLDLAGSQVTITMEVDAETIYTREEYIGDDTQLLDWWMYFFAPIHAKSELVFNDLPSYEDCTITVQIDAPVTAKCGTLVLGQNVEFGSVKPGAKIGIIDYSKKTVDEWGVAGVVKRAYARTLDLDVTIPNERVDFLAQALSDVRATPCVWKAATRYDSLTVYGFWKDWDITIPYPNLSLAHLTIEGLT